MQRPTPTPFGQQQLQSKPIGKKKTTAIIKGETIDKAVPLFIRLLLVFVLAIGYLGTIMAFDGDWDAFLASLPYFWITIHPFAAGFGIFLQTVFTAIQWWKRKEKRHPLYRVSFIGDTLFTTLGWWPFVGVAFVRVMLSLGLSSAIASVLAGGILLGISAFIAWAPEQGLIDG